LVAAFEDQKIEGLRQLVLDAWMMTANSEFARHTVAEAVTVVEGHDPWGAIFGTSEDDFLSMWREEKNRCWRFLNFYHRAALLGKETIMG
jgi:hypothetical protein